jgi:hypothetical protein
MSRTELPEFSQSTQSGSGFQLLSSVEHTVGVYVPAAERAAANVREERAASYVAKREELAPEVRMDLLELLGLVDAAKRVIGRED